jgi:hypothetical protein
LKTKYPEYINGVKQIQNPLHRLFVRVWYSDWFRFFFILLPLWWIFIVVILASFDVDRDLIVLLSVSEYLLMATAAIEYNDYSNLRRIGLDENHNKIEVDEE